MIARVVTVESTVDFESLSLRSLDQYLETLESLNEKHISLSIEACRSELEELIQAFSFAIETYKAFLLREESSQGNHAVFDSITVRFVESLKILNDSLFLSITGRYPISRILERIAIESTVKGLFFYGASTSDLSKWDTGGKTAFKEVMHIIYHKKKENPEATPFQLEDYVTASLQERRLYLGLRPMLMQLHDWGLALQDFKRMTEFLTAFNTSYRNLSGFIHASLYSTYTYQERTRLELETRVFWGAQFSDEALKLEIQEIMACIDFLLSLVLSALPSGYITEAAQKHLMLTRRKFSFLENRLVLSYPLTQEMEPADA